MGNRGSEVDHGDAGATIGLVGGFKALDLGVAVEVIVDAAFELAGAVAVDDPEGTAGVGDGFFEDGFGFGDTHSPQVDGVAASADGGGRRSGLGGGHGVLGFGLGWNFGLFTLEGFDIGEADGGFHQAEADSEFVVVVGGGEDFGGLAEAGDTDAVADLGLKARFGLD